jgi:hypothetical protein
VAPVSGAQAHYGKDNENGARMAIEDLNAQNIVIAGKKIKFEINKERKELIIQSVPAEEIVISPDVKFFDIQTSTFTDFEAADINKVNTQTKKKIEEQIETSGIKKNAKLQLVQSLNGIVGITNTLGWRVIDNTNTIQLSK